MRHLAQLRDALGPAVLAGALITAGACSDTSTTNYDAGFDGASSDGEAGSSGGLGDHGGESGDPGGTSGSEDDDYGDTEGSGGSTGGDSGGDIPRPADGPYATCPDPLPQGWIYCEDFESSDPVANFFDYVDADGNFVPSYEGAASGVGSMRAHYREGQEGAGFLSVSFGANPINTTGRPGHAAEEDFDEIYWRFRVKMEEGWPDAGPHNLTQISAFAQSDWGQAMVASVSSKGDDVFLEATAASCVQAGQVECSGVDDAESLQPLGTLVGDTPVFSSSRAGIWQCVEAHVKLNTPGELDGVFQLWVDGRLEAASDGIDWRGSWAEFGLNLLSLENLWVGGAPADLDRWFDDLVISTDPIGCE